VHFRNAVALAKEWFLYVIQWQTPPWSYCRVLRSDRGEAESCLPGFEHVWATLRRLESSVNPLHKEFLQALFFNVWAVFREPMLLWEQEKFGWSERAFEYVRAMFPDYATSLALENTFNHLRDNERRGSVWN
jgi:hypothetical protein